MLARDTAARMEEMYIVVCLSLGGYQSGGPILGRSRKIATSPPGQRGIDMSCLVSSIPTEPLEQGLEKIALTIVSVLSSIRTRVPKGPAFCNSSSSDGTLAAQIPSFRDSLLSADVTQQYEMKTGLTAG